MQPPIKCTFMFDGLMVSDYCNKNFKDMKNKLCYNRSS